MCKALVAVEALVQDTVCTAAQVSAVRWLKTADSLQASLCNTFWQAKMGAFWESAADEVVAGTQMDTVIQALGGDLKQASDAWITAMASFAKWSKLRDGAVRPAVVALIENCKRQWAALGGPESSEWAEKAEQLVARIEWLQKTAGAYIQGAESSRAAPPEGEVDSGSDSLESLQALVAERYNKYMAEQRVAKLCAMMRQFVASPADSSVIANMLREISECQGMSLHGDHHGAAKEFLGALHKDVSDSQRARAGEAIARMMATNSDASSPAAPQGDASSLAAWTKLLRGWEVAELSDVGKDLTKASRVAEAVQAWRLAEGEADIAEGGALAEAIQKAATAAAGAFLHALKTESAALAESATTLRDLAGGRPGGGQWKESLTSSSTWEEVAREADYYLLAKGELLHKSLDKITLQVRKGCDSVQAARGGLATLEPWWSTQPIAAETQQAVASAQSLKAEVDTLEQVGRVTHTESYLYHVICSKGRDRPDKIQNRIEKMASHGVESSQVQPHLWRKALALATSR